MEAEEVVGVSSSVSLLYICQEIHRRGGLPSHPQNTIPFPSLWLTCASTASQGLRVLATKDTTERKDIECRVRRPTPQGSCSSSVEPQKNTQNTTDFDEKKKKEGVEPYLSRGAAL